MTLSLILVHQPIAQAYEDWEKIGGFVAGLAPDISVYIANNQSRCALTKKRAARAPTLVFSPFSLDVFHPDRGKIHQGRAIDKIAQMKALREAGVNVPDFVEITPDMGRLPESLGEIVLVKASGFGASNDRGMELRRAADVRFRAPESYPDDHPGRFGPMFAQRFIDTGEHPSYYRVLTMFGEPLLAYMNRSSVPRGALAAGADLSRAIVSARRKTGQTKILVEDPDVIALARKAHAAFPDVPVQACDIVRDAATGELHMLEVNPGGNTWIFSRPNTPRVREELGGIDLTSQFDAFRTAARLLVEKTRAEAV